MLAGLQVLADGDHVHVMGTQVADGTNYLIEGFAQADHDAAFCADVRATCLVLLEQIQRVLVTGPGADVLVKIRHGFDVVIEYIRSGGFENIQGGIEARTEVRCQDLDGGVRGAAAYLANTLRKMLSATIGQVIPVHRSNITT